MTEKKPRPRKSNPSPSSQPTSSESTRSKDEESSVNPAGEETSRTRLDGAEQHESRVEYYSKPKDPIDVTSNSDHRSEGQEPHSESSTRTGPEEMVRSPSFDGMALRGSVVGPFPDGIRHEELSKAQVTSRRQPQPSGATSASANDLEHFVVGIGASAGGLEALEKLFASMPLDTNMAFVVVQHLSPDFESHMEKLLGRVTSLPIQVVSDGVRVEPNHVYLIPPRKDMVVSNGRLLLTERSPERVLSHPIDQFFRALAQDFRSRSIGVVLSGTGSDGSRGVVDISEAGGLSIVQSPESCKFDTMPRNALRTGSVHLVLPPEQIGQQIQRYALTGATRQELHDENTTRLEGSHLEQILQLLQSVQGIDFSNYKIGTVSRRIARRVELLKLKGLDAYVQHIQEDAEELNALYRDLLIGVTKFFRDEEAFEFLQQEILPKLLNEVRDDEIRVWTCGCATGEEAYSLAITLSEAIQSSGSSADFKIFATDAHRTSLQIAAAGIYRQEQLDELPQAWRDKYFERRDEAYSVTSSLRRRMVFAPHDVLSDPPFTQMDLVVCRNLLIYFRPEAQRKILSLFHFALRTNGTLFLGPSETPGDFSDEFDAVESRWKIYRKRRDVRLPIEMRLPSPPVSPQVSPTPSREISLSSRRNHDPLPAVYDVLLNDYMPPSVLVDEKLDILHSFQNANDFLKFPSGRPTTSLLDVVTPDLRTPLSAAVRHALQEGKLVRYSGLPHPQGQSNVELQITIRPVASPSLTSKYFLIQFEPTENRAAIDSLDDTLPSHDKQSDELHIDDLEATRLDSVELELSQTKQNLQATIEELETSNEELQAANEEMVASNEELQSTNEELHSVNEELYSVNAEHQRRLVELNEAHADMNNLLETTRVGVVFLDRELSIRRFTPELGRLLELEQRDIGRPIDLFCRRLNDDTSPDGFRRTLDSLSEQQWELKFDGESYLVRALPYWTMNRIDGVVAAFINVDPLRRAEAELEQFKFMCDQAIDAHILLDKHGMIQYANLAMAERIGYELNELQGMSIVHLGEVSGRNEFSERLHEARDEEGCVFETVHRHKDGSEVSVEVTYTYIEINGEPYIYGNSRDISSRLSAEADMRLLQKAIATVANGIVIADATQEGLPITFANDGILRMLEVEAEEVLEQPLRSLYSTWSPAEGKSLIDQGVDDRTSCRALLQIERNNRSPLWVDFQCTPVHDRQSHVSHIVCVLNDVTENIQMGEVARTNEKTVRLLLDSTAEGIFGIDSRGLCTFCNASAAKMLGYDAPDELVSRSIHALIHHHKKDGSDYEMIDCPMINCVSTGESVNRADEVFWRKDGTSFSVEYWSHPILKEDRCVGAVITFVDNTQRLRFENELREARNQADVANEAKSRFLANMSHELRTPLSAMLGFTEILQQQINDEEHLDKLSTIRRNGDYLLKLLNDVLDLSRIESGKLQASSQKSQLALLLSDVNEMMQLRTRDNGTQLRFHCPNQLPSTVTTDEARLRQILINLIANAIKFSPEGKVDVNVAFLSETQELQFEVQDDGIGISEEHQRTLFQPFSQGDATIAKRFGGTGLGLSITGRLVEILGGTISVDSTKGIGSKFTVVVPVAPCGEAIDFSWETPLGESASPEPEQPQSSLSIQKLSAKILIADDMADIRYVAKYFLSSAGCDVQSVENGLQAVEQIHQAARQGSPYELVLMDVQMPVLDGESALKRLRTDYPKLPVIALTADAMKGTRRRLIDAGFDEYLTKPIDGKRLVAVVHRILSRSLQR